MEALHGMSKAEDDLIEAIFAEHAAEPSRAPSSLVLPGDKVTVVLEAIDASVALHERQAQTKVFSDRQRCLAVLSDLRRAREVLTT